MNYTRVSGRKATEDSPIGFVSDFVDDITGKSGRRAANKASAQQVAATNRAIDLQEDTFNTIRDDLAPFRQHSETNVNALQNLVRSPSAQYGFIHNNPFYEAILGDERRKTMQNYAARGKLGSGETLKALDENVLRVGQGLVDNQTNKLFNLANMGQNTAALQASTAQNSANATSNLLTQQGNAAAAGTIGANNANVAGTNNLLKLIGLT